MDYMGERFERKVGYLGISLERGTPNVPDDDRYHVLCGIEIRYSSHNKTLADAHFDLLREQVAAANPQLVDPRTVLAKERSFNDILSVRATARERARTQQEARGGKGGRSGV
ncbi:hypothetical protein [Micromonospora wenchangensis]|uniref:hypothetical protein n=1 Tax=Micromonospora wenchangensis TaxID=1185415 RepID=UPI0034423B80